MKPKRVGQFIAVFVVLAFLFSLVYFALPYFTHEDMQGTLREYEIKRDEETVRKYLLKTRGEADAHGNYIEFVHWGINSPEDFIKIIESGTPAEKARLGQLIGFAASDSSQDDEFEIAFKNFDSEALRIARTEINRSRSYQNKR
ncbi:MAG: hypothetical protein WBD27_20140 [Pyrinomonadaceae bacterium]